MTAKEQSFSPEEIRQIKKENRRLKIILRRKEQKIKGLKSVISKQFHIIDTLQSFIPERGKWRSIYLNRYN